MRKVEALLLLLLAGCAPASPDMALDQSRAGPCGPAAAMLPGAREEYRDHPPACALPTPQELASVCAVRDALKDPGHRWPEQDETGMAVGGDPLPEYVVDQVDCAFTDRHRNRAQCSFRLHRPELDTGPVATSLSLTNVFYADHGPAHHMYWAFWQADHACTPED